MKMAGFLAMLILGGGMSWASDLKWETPVLEVQAARGQKTVDGEFRFTNTSQAPVEIREVKTSCGCTMASIPKNVYGPGESGVLKVVFTPEGRRGVQKKTIAVRSGDKKSKPDVLAMIVDLEK